MHHMLNSIKTLNYLCTQVDCCPLLDQELHHFEVAIGTGKV